MPERTADIDVEELHAYGLGEEIANSVTHGVGALLSVVGMTVLVMLGALANDGWRLAAAIVYGTSLVLEYTASTLYHALPQPKAKYAFKLLDHSGIYLLIAGSYTPFCLITLRDSGGWWIFALIWTIAFAGIALEAFWVFRPRWLSALTYIGMGWLVVFSIRPLVANLDPAGVWLLIAGGLAYTLGTVFYVFKRIPYFHMVWHLWVLAGSVCHFLSVALFVMPAVR